MSGLPILPQGDAAETPWRFPNANVYWRPDSFGPGDHSVTPVCVEMYGHEVWGPDRSFSRDGASNVSVELITGGSMIYTQDGRVTEVDAGQLYILRPGTRQRQFPGSRGFCIKRFVVLTGPLIPMLIELMGREAEAISVPAFSGVKSLFRRVWQLRHQQTDDTARQASVLAYEILTLVINACADKLPSRLRPVMDRINDNTTWPSLDELAGLARLSRSQFVRVFRAEFGQSPGDYMAAHRMRRAAHYLRSTSWAVGQVAERLGYDTPYYFSRQFTKHFGVSPTDYRTGAGKELPKREGENLRSPAATSTRLQ